MDKGEVPKGQDKPVLHDKDFSDDVSEVTDVNQIDNLGDSEKVNERTRRIIKFARDVGYKSFEVQTRHGKWFIVAKSSQSIAANRDTIESFDDEQAKTELWGVWGACTTLHDQACKDGVIDGEMRSIYDVSDRDKIRNSIYPEGSGGVGHYIGFKDTGLETIYVDLTARANIFTPTIYDKQSAFNGLVVIEPSKSTAAIDQLYAAKWVRHSV